jgi:hypothetical protein
LPNQIENLGKRPLEQSGKHHVNENDEDIFAACGFDPRIIAGFGVTVDLESAPSSYHSGARV